MRFVNPMLLAGLCGALLPVVIHLLTRDRIRRVPFSTLRFFAGVSSRVLRRHRFREAVLLAARVLLCALAAVAFARPYLRSNDPLANPQTQAATARVVVVDLSASMTRPGITDSLQQESREALAGLAEGVDVAALVTFCDTPNVQVRWTKDFTELKETLGRLTPTEGGTDLAAALRAADALLRQAEAKTKQIVLVSDFQKVGWRSFKGDWSLAPGVSLVLRPVEPTQTSSNVAVTQANCPASMILDRAPRTVAARITNYSADDLTGVEVNLNLQGKTVASQKVQLQAGRSADVRFRQVFDRLGDNPGTISVGADDADRGDNLYYFNARVAQQIKVVVLNGKPDANPLQDSAFFVKLALMPTKDAPFAVETCAASSAKAADLVDAVVVVLTNVGSVSAEVKTALTELLNRGGGLFFLPGDRVKAETFNEVFADIAPCKLRRVLTPTPSAGRASEALLTKIDYNHPVFQEFYRPQHGDLSMPRFVKYWEVSYLDLAEAGTIRVPARFDDSDRPAIVERRLGPGISLMLTSPADLAWNSLPLRAIFLPYLHETVHYLAVRTERPTAYRIGDRLEVPAPCRLRGPDGRLLPPDDPTARQPGFYKQVSATGAEEFVFAVNRELSEADPTPLAPERIRAAVEGPRGEESTATGDGTFDSSGQAPDDQNLGWFVMLGLAGLLFVELVLGNHTLRH